MNFNIITYIATVVAGVFFIVCRQGSDVLTVTNRIAALIFIISGIINFVTGLRNNRRDVKGWTATFGLMLVSTGAVALGVLMLAFPALFLPYVAITLGVVLVLCGVFQLVAVLRGGAKDVRRWFVVLPLLAMASGVVLMVLQDKDMTAAWWAVTGCVLIACGINGLVAMSVLKGDEKNGDGTVIVR